MSAGAAQVEVPLGEGWSPRPVGTKRLPGPGCLLWWDPPCLGSPEVPPSSMGKGNARTGGASPVREQN